MVKPLLCPLRAACIVALLGSSACDEEASGCPGVTTGSWNGDAASGETHSSSGFDFVFRSVEASGATLDIACSDDGETLQDAIEVAVSQVQTVELEAEGMSVQISNQPNPATFVISITALEN